MKPTTYSRRLWTITVGEVTNRERFTARSLVVNQMLRLGSKLSRKQLWALATRAL